MLLDKGADVEGRGIRLWRPKTLKSECSENRDSSTPGVTLLHFVIVRCDSNKEDRFDIVRLLLAKCANVNARDGHGMTPLFFDTNDIDLLRLLLKKGANANVTNDGDTPLFGANRKAAILLIKNGADVNIKRADGNTPLHYAMWLGYSLRGNDNPIHVLLENGAKVNARNDEGETPLCVACRYRYSVLDHDDKYYDDSAITLVRNGADANIKSHDGMSPLHWVCDHADICTARCLLDEGRANVNEKDKAGWTPLHYTCNSSGIYRYSDRLTEALLARGADPMAKDEMGRTPLDVARKKENWKIIRLLEKEGEC